MQVCGEPTCSMLMTSTNLTWCLSTPWWTARYQLNATSVLWTAATLCIATRSMHNGKEVGSNLSTVFESVPHRLPFILLHILHYQEAKFFFSHVHLSLHSVGTLASYMSRQVSAPCFACKSRSRYIQFNSVKFSYIFTVIVACTTKLKCHPVSALKKGKKQYIIV